MSQSKHSTTQPKSIRQKRVLDIAANRPGATLAEIADEVPSASTAHVDRILNQYGDPAADDQETDDMSGDHSDTSSDGTATSDTDANKGKKAATEDTDDSTQTTNPDDSESTDHTEGSANATEPDAPVTADDATESDASVEPGSSEPVVAADPSASEMEDEAPPSPDELTQKERETLRAICYEPEATQKQIANMLSVSRATVSNRVNAIPGFDWAKRQAFVDGVFDGELTVASDSGPEPSTAEPSVMDTTEPSTPDSDTQALTDGASGLVSDESSGVPTPDVTRDITGDDVDSTVSEPDTSTPTSRDASGSETAPADEAASVSHGVDELSERLAAVEQAITDSDSSDDGSPFDDAELVHKVVYACMNSERVSEEEELRVLEELMD